MMVEEKAELLWERSHRWTPIFSEKFLFICARLRFDPPTEILCLESQNIS